MYGITFIGFPILALFLRNHFGAGRIVKYALRVSPFTVWYLLAYYLGYSFRGDYIDYSLLALSYLWLCLLLFSTEIYKSGLLKVLRVAVYVSVGLIGIFCFLTFPFFAYAAQDFEWDRKFNFKDNGENKYEVRRYTYGGVFNSNTRYIFKTYRVYGVVPLEKQIDITDFFDDRTDLFISDSIAFSISKTSNGQQLQFTDKYGKSFVKLLR